MWRITLWHSDRSFITTHAGRINYILISMPWTMLAVLMINFAGSLLRIFIEIVLRFTLHGCYVLSCITGRLSWLWKKLLRIPCCLLRSSSSSPPCRHWLAGCDWFSSRIWVWGCPGDLWWGANLWHTSLSAAGFHPTPPPHHCMSSNIRKLWRAPDKYFWNILLIILLYFLYLEYQVRSKQDTKDKTLHYFM